MRKKKFKSQGITMAMPIHPVLELCQSNTLATSHMFLLKCELKLLKIK